MSRHLFKMLLGLVGMAIFGLIGLIIINLYHKQNSAEAGILPRATSSNCVTTC